MWFLYRSLHLLEYSLYLLIAYFLFLNFFFRTQVNINYIDLIWYINNKKKTTYRLDYNDFWPQFKKNYYYYKNDLFYYDNYGQLLHQRELSPLTRAKISLKSYITYEKVGYLKTLYTLNGQKKWELYKLGYPHLSPSGNRIAFLSTDNSILSLYDFNRVQILSNYFLDTSVFDLMFSEFDDNLLLGTSSGFFILIDYQGNVLFKENLTGSEYNYVKSVSSSPDSSYYVALHGLLPEYISLYDSQGNRKWISTTQKHRIRKTSMHIDTTNNFLILHYENQLVFRSLKTGEHLFDLSLSNFEIKEISYFKAVSKNKRIIFAINGKETNLLLVYNLETDFIYQHFLKDKWILDVELSEDKDHILLQTSQNIYSFRMYEDSN